MTPIRSALPLDPARNPDVNQPGNQAKDQIFGGAVSKPVTLDPARNPDVNQPGQQAKDQIFGASSFGGSARAASTSPRQLASEFLALVGAARPADAQGLKDAFQQRFDKGPFTQITLPEESRLPSTQGLPETVQAEVTAKEGEEDLAGEVRIYELKLDGQSVLVVNKEYEADSVQSFSLFSSDGAPLGTAVHGDMGGFEWLS